MCGRFFLFASGDALAGLLLSHTGKSVAATIRPSPAATPFYTRLHPLAGISGGDWCRGRTQKPRQIRGFLQIGCFMKPLL